MSVYAIDKLCRDALHDIAFREAVKRDPAAAIASRDLTDDERSALLSGDVARLYQWGCHPFLLTYLTRWDLFGRSEERRTERRLIGEYIAVTEEIIRRVDALEHEQNMADFAMLLTRSHPAGFI